MAFEKQLSVNFYDCDSANMLKVSAAMRYMHQTSSEHLEALDMAPEKLFRQSMVFLLTKMCIKVHRMPVCNEKIVVSTAAVAVRGVRFYRDFTIDGMGGERLLSAVSLWILADPTTHKVLRPSSFPYPLPLQESILDGAITDLPFPKLLSDGKNSSTKIEVRYSHLDINQHVTNSVYGDFVCDALPYNELIQRGLDTIVIHFKNEARHGETIEIKTYPLGKGEYHLFGTHGTEKPCFEAYALLA